MAVSDETGGEVPKRERRSRKGVKLHLLSPAEWQRIQTHYETDPDKIALRPLADLYGVPRQTVMLRAAREKWTRRDHITTLARRELEQSAQITLKDAVTPVLEEIAKKALSDLQPWIERKKRTHIRSQVLRSHRALSRLDRLTNGKSKPDAKEEAFIAKSVDTYDNVARRNLGMNEGSGLGGSLSIQVLTNQAAVQVSQSS